MANRRRPVYQSDRISVYEFDGPKSQCEVRPNEVVIGYHITDVTSLFGACREEAWPEQSYYFNGGLPYLDIGSGILIDGVMRGGTNSHDHNVGTNFYIHFEIAASYLSKGKVIIELMSAESTKLSGRGQWGRYCSKCSPNMINEKVSLSVLRESCT